MSRLLDLGIVKRMCKRYVDDVNLAADELPAGTRYVEGGLAVSEAEVASDLLVPADRRTMEVIRDVGNSIHWSIQLEIDYPSNYSDGKMPSLDLKLHVSEVDGRKQIIHEFYMKDVSSKAVINADSALSLQQKRTILTQETLRVLLNCSPYVFWQDVARHASKMVLRMQFSGFSKKFRYEVVCSALSAYDSIHDKVRRGERPLYRPFEWDREERDRAKAAKVLNWYKVGGYESVMFVQSTPNSELKRRFQKEIDKSGLKIRVVEKAGRSIKQALQRSDPFKAATCDREGCLVCETEGKGSCGKDGINYEIDCVECEENGSGGIYHGESAHNGFTRGDEHLKDLDRKDKSSILWRHCKERHGGIIPDFRMSITGYYRHDAMLRQISEAVRIGGVAREELINNKTEWNYVNLPRVVVDNGEGS